MEKFMSGIFQYAHRLVQFERGRARHLERCRSTECFSLSFSTRELIKIRSLVGSTRKLLLRESRHRYRRRRKRSNRFGQGDAHGST